jgi:hypothetical protein
MRRAPHDEGAEGLGVSTGLHRPVRLLTDLQRIIELLEHRHVTPGGRFELFYALRNPRQGRGNGPLGVRDEAIIDAYAAALDRTYDHLRAEGWRDPIADGDRIPVYVYNPQNPFASNNIDGRPFLALRAELSEPTMEDSLRKAAVDATHEAVHTFTHLHRPLKLGPSQAWFWFDEATAVHFESRLNLGNPATLRYAMTWINVPEQPLELKQGYCSAWLVRHLVDAHDDPILLRDAWQTSHVGESPATVLDRLIRARGRFGSFAEFVHDYAMTSHRVEPLDPRAGARFGTRAIAYACPLDGTAPPTWGDTLEPLSCRYYRIGLGALAPGKVRLSVAPDLGEPHQLWATALREPARGGTLTRFPLSPGPDGLTLKAVVPLAGPEDRILLVVTNTETQAQAARREVEDRATSVTVTVGRAPA